MTESDFNQIRLIVTDTVAASEERMSCALAETEERMTRVLAASEKCLSEALTRALVELDRRIADLEKHMMERQDAALQRAVEQMAKLARQIETNLLNVPWIRRRPNGAASFVGGC